MALVRVVDLSPGDPVVVTTMVRRRPVSKHGAVVSVTDRHCLVDLGAWKESFPLDQISRVMTGGAVVSVTRAVGQEAVNRIVDERDRREGRHIGEWLHERFFDDDAPRPEWIQPKGEAPMTTTETPQEHVNGTPKAPESLPQDEQLQKVAELYNNGAPLLDIRTALSCGQPRLKSLIQEAHEQGRIPKLRRSGRGGARKRSKVQEKELIPSEATTAGTIRQSQADAPGGHYEALGRSIGALVDEKQRAYGDSFGQALDVLKVYLRPYRNADGTYTIPEALLQHVLVQVRIIDKQFRIFTHPGGDAGGESPYRDLAGYSILAEARYGKRK